MGNSLERQGGEGSPSQGSASPTRRAAAALTSSWRHSSPDTPTRGSPSSRKSSSSIASSLYASTSLAPPSPSSSQQEHAHRRQRQSKHRHREEPGGTPSSSPPSLDASSPFHLHSHARAASSSPTRSREGSIVLEPFPTTPPGSSLSATPTTSFHAQSLLATLPATVLARIFSSLSSADLLRCALVSKEWLVLASMEAWWEELALNELESPGLVSVMLHERAELPHLTRGSWRELYWKYRRKEALTLHPRVVALYDYRARTENEIDVTRGEVLRLLAKDRETCWWLVQRTSDKAEPPQPVRGPRPSAPEQQGREEGEEEGNEKEKELKEEEEGVAKTKETTEGEEEEVEEGTAADEPGLDEEKDDHSGAVQAIADDAGGGERVADVTTDEQQQEQPDEEEKRSDVGHGGGAVAEPEGRKPATTIGWVPSGYLDYCPRKASAARALRSEAAAAAADAQDARQLQERNKKVPFMVRAKFDYVAANAQELSFKKYDLMAIELHPREKYPIPFDADEGDDDDDGEQAAMAAAERADTMTGQWWKASLTRRSTTGGTTTVSGWIPVNLVTEEVTHVIALFDYVPVDEEELPLKKGQRVAVLATDENRKGWIYAQGNGRRGWLPENYVVDDDDA